MSQDLFLGVVKKDWSRGPSRAIVVESRPEEPLTEADRERLARLAVLKMKASSGDRLAKLKWKKIKINVAILKMKARKGDPKARHDLAVLDGSGLLGRVQTISGVAESKDQDIIDRLILRSGSAAGWPVYISKAQYADYQSRAAKKDARAVEVLVILGRYAKEGKLKISDDRKADQSRYPIGGDESGQARKQLEEQARRGSARAIAKLKRIRLEEAMSMHGNSGSFVGASDTELERLMSKSLTDDQLDRIMTRVVQDDRLNNGMIEVLRILQRRPDHGVALKNRIKLRASDGHLDARKMANAIDLHDRAVAGDPAAKKVFVDWCSTHSHSSSGSMASRVAYLRHPRRYRHLHSSSGSMASQMNKIAARRDAAYFASHHRHLPGYRVSGDDSLGAFVGSDELELARDGGACERAALARTSGIVISDREIKDAMRGSLSLVGGRRRHHHHHRRRPSDWRNMSSTTPGIVPGNIFNQVRDAQKSQIVRRLYSQIKREHINWMINLDHQNNIWNQTPDKYQQAARAWARDQLQQQQLPTRLTPAGTNPWIQPVSWFQAQAQAVLNASAGQRSASADASSQNPSAYGTSSIQNPSAYGTSSIQNPSAYGSSSIQNPSAYGTTSIPTPMSPSTSNAYYPAPGGAYADNPALYDDDQEGDSFVGDEERAQGEDSGKWHWGSPFRKIGRGFKKVGRGFERGLKTTGLVAVDALKSAPMALSHGDFVGETLSHNEYRALVLDQAIKKAGGNRPGTKHLFAAKKAVDSALGRSGTSIYIPGAGPARRTV